MVTSKMTLTVLIKIGIYDIYIIRMYVTACLYLEFYVHKIPYQTDANVCVYIYIYIYSIEWSG